MAAHYITHCLHTHGIAAWLNSQLDTGATRWNHVSHSIGIAFKGADCMWRKVNHIHYSIIYSIHLAYAICVDCVAKLKDTFHQLTLITQVS